MKRLTAILSFLLVICLCVATAAGCAVNFEGRPFKGGRVGDYYSDTIAGGGDLIYNLEENSHLPYGLTLMADGAVRG